MDAEIFFREHLDYGALGPLPGWEAALSRVLRGRVHGALDDWHRLLLGLPYQKARSMVFDQPVITLEGALDSTRRDALRQALMALHPWRKGPYSLFGVEIDTEWRSDLKWQRLASSIAPLQGRRVLDVGCGSGYHALRMLGAGAQSVIGIDPTWLSVVQFLAIKRMAGRLPVEVFPLGIDDVPAQALFDSVFSMGILYHRRSPLDHLLELRALLRGGGELVLETLVIDGDEGQVLLPRARYAQMRNVWFIPSPATLQGWLERTGYRAIRLIDVSVTTPEEQRRTAWMQFHSLSDFLDPEDSTRTIEGYPAPRRALFLAEAPSLS